MTPIYEVTLPNSTISYAWLCDAHATGKPTGRTTVHQCDRCPRAEVTFTPSPTSASARLLERAPAEPKSPWSKR
jgi:hypothetical protein